MMKSTAGKHLTKSRKKGIVIVGLCIAACKLPFLLAFLGFAGLGSTVSILEFSPTIKTIGVVASLVGIVITAGYLIYRTLQRRC